MNYIRSRKHNSARIAAMVAATFSLGANAADQAEAQLPEVQVTSAPEVPFKANESASNKFTKPLVDTPQTVQVIKKELLREQGVLSLTDALRNSPGITMQMGENGNTSAGDTFSMRGFSAQNSLFVDGIRDLGAVSRDVFNIEQIEVIKGPAGADVGRAAAAGYVNLISKLPSLDSQNYATLSYGTADKKRGTLDLNQKIGENSAVRLNLLGFDGNVDKRDEVDNQNFSIAPSIAFGLETDTRAYIYSQHVRQDNTPDGGIPSIGRRGFFSSPSATAPAVTAAEADAFNNGRKVDRENYYGSDHDREKVDADMITAKFEHDLSESTTIRNISRYGKSKLDRIVTGVNVLNAPTPADPSTWQVTRTRQAIDREDEILINQTSLNTTFNLGGFKNAFTGGLELSYERQKNKGFTTLAVGSIPFANLYNPDENDALPMPPANGIDGDGKTNTVAVYAFDTVDLNEQWQVNGGLRYEYYKADTDTGTVHLDSSDNLLSGKVGVLYKPAPNGSIYASYATSYTPPGIQTNSGSANFALTNTANNQNNPALNPQRTKSAEVGTKWDLLNNQLNVSGAVFAIENSNQTSFDDLGAPTQSGRTLVNGIELLAIGQLTRAWQLSAGITAMDAKALDQQNATGVVTDGVRWTPELSATVWSQYNLGNWTFGGGARYIGDQKRLVTDVDASTQNMPEIPSYVVADAMVGYKFNKQLNLRLNVYNIFDKDYIETMNNSGARVRLGVPRSALLTAEFMF
jgi:catecholate siderophore receptor